MSRNAQCLCSIAYSTHFPSPYSLLFLLLYMYTTIILPEGWGVHHRLLKTANFLFPLLINVTYLIKNLPRTPFYSSVPPPTFPNVLFFKGVFVLQMLAQQHVLVPSLLKPLHLTSKYSVATCIVKSLVTAQYGVPASTHSPLLTDSSFKIHTRLSHSWYTSGLKTFFSVSFKPSKFRKNLIAE